MGRWLADVAGLGVDQQLMRIRRNSVHYLRYVRFNVLTTWAALLSFRQKFENCCGRGMASIARSWALSEASLVCLPT